MVERLSLPDEIMFNQVAQGVLPDIDLLERFNQLDDEHKRMRVHDLLMLIHQSKFNEADVKQVTADEQPSKTNNQVFITLWANWLSKGLRINLGEEELERSYALLLRLFKTTYQRCYKLKKDSPANWWYWDLSNPEVVQSILTRHQELVDEIYHDPGFRSEFACIAKLWNNRIEARSLPEPESNPERQTHFNYLSHDEITERSMTLYWDKNGQSIWLLQNALNKALSRKYGLEVERITRVTFDVIERHLRETYNSALLSAG